MRRQTEDESYNMNIVIESKEHFDSLIQEGLEIYSKTYQYDGIKNQLNIALVLKRNDQKILANANAIHEYAVNLQYLYDFEVKRPKFVYAPPGALYWDFEETMGKMAINEHIRPLRVKRIPSANSARIYDLLLRWIINERNAKYGVTKLSELFSVVCIVNEKEGNLWRKIVVKEDLSIEGIFKLVGESTEYDNSIAMSFFLLSKKLNKMHHSDDGLVGMIILDLKTGEPLCFNIISLEAFYRGGQYTFNGFYEICLNTFQKTLNKNGEFSSFIPLPLDSPWYTCLPWICFSVLSPITLDKRSDTSHECITIPQFFTFGFSPFVTDGHSFDYKTFSSSQSGHATCVLYFNDNDKEFIYNLRFDRSRGEPLVHLDYSFYNNGHQTKLIRHRPLDMEQVYRFNSDLFISIMSAGFFDAHFTTILEKGMKGITKLAKDNPVFLYPLRYIWEIDTNIIWLNKHPAGFKILDKLYRRQQLNEEEIKLVNEMFNNHMRLVIKDKKCNIIGLNFIGYTILMRYKRGQTQIKMA